MLANLRMKEKKINVMTKGKSENNYAFIDSQNLNLSIRNQGWTLDFKKFRKYLIDKYGITKAFIFIGFVPQNQDLYTVCKKMVTL